jgi:hypothetical protein
MPSNQPRTNQRSQWEDADFWRSLCPDLHISHGPLDLGRVQPCEISQEDVQVALRQVVREGYFQLPSVFTQEQTRLMLDGVRRLIEAGYPAPFLLLYDEPWMLLSALDRLLHPILGDGYRLTEDAWIYYIRAADEAVSGVKEESGWPPHRDGFFRLDTLRDDGRPLVLNVWIPLDDVSLQQSCMHVLPTNRDPHYPGELKNFDVPEDARAHVRALAAVSGAVLGWNEYVLHWGGVPQPGASRPRVSLAVRYQSEEIGSDHPTHLNRHSDLEFKDRLGVVGSSMWRYRARFKCPEPLRTFSHEQAKLYMAVQKFRSLKR